MKRTLLFLMAAIPLAAIAQTKSATSNTPTVLVRDTCEPPTESVSRSVFAITCNTDEVLLMMTIKKQGKTEIFWERHPIDELRKLTEGIRYRTVNQTGKK